MATPSLAMIPSAYADSKVYSVLPNNGDGDFSFNRDSSATRVGQNGLIQEVGFFGNDLVVNGDFVTDTNWSKNAGITISGGSVNFTGLAGQYASQDISFVSGKVYKINFNVLSGSGTLTVFLGAGNNVSPGSFSIGKNKIIATGGGADTKIYFGSTFTGSITNISVQEVTGDQPRLNYDISNGVVQSCPSLLLEPASTNLVLNSATGAYGNGPGSELITTAPDGTNTAIIPIPNSTSDRYQETITGGTYATGTKLTYSWYSKQISVPVGTFVGNLKVQILVNATQVGANIKVKDSINGWAKYSATFNITDGSLQSIIRLYFGNVILTGNQSVAYWGHQLEALPYCTSLIPTDGSSQTRAAESCIKENLSSTILEPSYPFTMYAKFDIISTNTGYAITLLNPLISSQYFTMEYFSNLWHITSRPNGASIRASSTTAPTIGTHKVLGIFTQSDMKLYLNGSLIVSGTNNQAWNNSINALLLGQLRISGDTGTRNSIRESQFFKTELTNAQAITLTTL